MTIENSPVDAGGNAVSGTRAEAEFAVASGRYYAFAVSYADPDDSAQATAVAEIRFLNSEGQQLRGPYAGASTSEKLGPYVAFPAGAKEGETWSRSVVRAPDGASRVLVRARRWKGSDAFTFTDAPRCVDEIDSARDVRTLQVAAGSTFRLEMNLVDAVASADAAVVQVVFRDGDGKAIESDYPGLTHSARFRNYLYAGAAAGAGKDTLLELLAPANAASLGLHLHAWKGGDALAFGREPAILRALPENLNEKEWIAVVEDIVVPVDLAGDATGKAQLIRLKTWSDRPTGEIVGHFRIEFPDSPGDDWGRESEVFSIEGTEGEQAEHLHVIAPPVGATRAVLRFRSKDRRSLAVSRHLPGRTIDFAGSDPITWPGGTWFEAKSAASQAWQLAIDVHLLRPVAAGLPELAVFFADAKNKTLAAGSLLTGEYAAMRSVGSTTYFTPKRAPTGVEGVELLTLSVRLLPPSDAHQLTARMVPGAGAEAVALQWSCDPFCRLVQQAIQPELSRNLAPIECASRDAALTVVDELMAAFPKSPEVVSACIDTCRRLGAVDQLRRLVPLAASLGGTPNARLRLKARLAAGSLEELDTAYLPRAGRVVRGKERAAADGLDGLRVAHLFKTTVPYENTGGAIRCRNIVRYQKRIGFDPLVITPLGYPHAGTTGEAWESDVVDGIPYYRLNPVSRDDLRDVPVTKQLEFATLLTTRLLQQRPVDMVQASSGYRGYEQALVGLAAARALGVPFVYEVRSYHEHSWRGMTDWILDAELTKLRFAQEDRCMREADAVVTICQTMKQGLVERGIDPDKIFVVPNSVDPDAFVQRPLDPQFKLSLGLREPTTVGYISNVSGREGHHVLLRAVARARAGGARIDCLIVGDGPELARQRELAVELGIASHVVFTGEVPHDTVSKYYGAIDVFVVPRVADFASDYVTPMKPYEAMAMGCPMVVSDRPALIEIVGEDGKRGVVFRAGDHADLARCLVDLAKSPAKRAALVQEGRRWIEQSRTWDATVHIYEQAYAYARQAAAANGKIKVRDA
jgi:glycosyltransferase involved in cell wall biosynthesis